VREQRAAVHQDKSSYHEHDKYQQTSEEDGGRSFPPTMLTELLGSALPIVLLGHSSHPKRKGLAASLVAARKGVPSARFTTLAGAFAGQPPRVSPSWRAKGGAVTRSRNCSPHLGAYGPEDHSATGTQAGPNLTRVELFLL